MITSTAIWVDMGCPFKNKILSRPHRGGTDMIPSYLPYNILFVSSQCKHIPKYKYLYYLLPKSLCSLVT